MASPSEFSVLAEGHYLEGLALAGDAVWFSDVTGGGLHRIAADGSRRAFLPERRWIGGLLALSDGALLVSGEGGILRLDPASGASEWFVHECAGQSFDGINEMAMDGQGGLYFGSVDLERIKAGQRTRPASLYYRHPAGEVRLACEGLTFANALAISPDGARLYCNESFDGTYVHDIAADGALLNRRKVLAKKDCDGMTFDGAGTLWITGFASSSIARLAPGGALLEPFETPAQAITQCRFGGADGRNLYLTAVPIDAGAGLAKGALPQAARSQLLKTRV